MALLSDDAVRVRLEYLRDVQAFCKDINLAEHAKIFYETNHNTELRKKFHVLFPGAGRGNFVATSTLALFAAPGFLDDVARFSKKKLEKSGGFMEGYLYYLHTMTDDDVWVDASEYLRDCLMVKHELDEHLQLKSPAKWWTLDSRCDLATYKELFMPKAPAQGSAAIKSGVRCEKFAPVE